MTVPYVSTSLVDVSATTYKDLPYRALYKNELEQPSGLFKLRGIAHCIQQALRSNTAEGASVHVYCSSGGNAGMAAAYASKQMGVPCTVVLPQTTKQLVIDKLKDDLEAEVIVRGLHWGEADAYLQKELIGLKGYPKAGSVYVHPFDNPVIWEGHASMIDEIVDQLNSEDDLGKVKGIVCSVGGGGLYNGIVEGLHRHESLKNVPVIAVETDQVPCFRDAVVKGEVVTLSGPFSTVATSLGSPYVSLKSLSNAQTHTTLNHVITETEALEGVVDYHDRFGTIVEPACGATLSLTSKVEVLNEILGIPLQADDIIIYIVCGGKATNEALLEQYRAMVCNK
ncbi:uncharacterized protein KQ657_000984 [Scheffersomyces spartinae]|uniref:L-serine ammonia-lyase n=1 Tax=Scheffersomyces spartinae TaxID=45513 RepID=A0A9P7V8B2_9ASCO|nr:uncharacterized protein KQ657_000984 [Scheffersomyces spartinae]KAG7193222.1 hypothetical protein KQ657_000984 [Scheffersomyces spartinae]